MGVIDLLLQQNTRRRREDESLHYHVKYKFSKFVPTAVTQQQIMHANPEENVATVDALVLSQED